MKKIFFLAGLALVSATIIVSAWQTHAATAYIDPNGDGTTAGTATACGGGGNYDCLNEATRSPTAPSISDDYVTLENNSTDFYDMTSISNLNSATSIEVFVYHEEGGTNMRTEVSLFDTNETTQYGSSQDLTNRTSEQWDSVTFSGLTLNQSQLDNLNIKIRCYKSGGGGPSNCINYATYGDVTHTLVITYEQSGYRWFGNDNSADVGAPLAAQDTAATAPAQGTPFRLRMNMHIGTSQLAQSGTTFKLQYSLASGGTPSTCDISFSGESYGDVATASGAIRYADNASPADGDNLTDNANDPVHDGHTNTNQDYEEANNFTNTVAAISAGDDGLWDFSLVDFSADAEAIYCFRMVESDATLLDTYSVIPAITTASPAPVASSVSIDSGASAVNLTENTTTTVSCTATVTDANGFADIDSVKAELHRSGVAAGSADDNNNHYTLSGDANCVPSGGSGNTENYTCDFAVQYYADPTDAGPYSAQNWECLVTPSDGDGDGTTDSDTIEMNSLAALDVEADLAYGTIPLGTDKAASINMTNTGNVNIDIQFSGTALTCTIGTVAVGQQKYGAAFAFSWGALPWILTGTPDEQDFDIPQRTGAVSTKDSYWRLKMPSTGVGGSCTGTNTFTAVNDIGVD